MKSITQDFNVWYSGQNECYAHLESVCKEMVTAGCKLEDFTIEHEMLEGPKVLDTKWVFRLMYLKSAVAEATLTIHCDPV